MGGTWICRHKDEGWRTFLLPVSPVCAFSPYPVLFFLVAIHIQRCLYFPTCLGRILCQPSNLCQLCDHANPITVIFHRARGQRPAATFPYNIYINKAFTASVSCTFKSIFSDLDVVDDPKVKSNAKKKQKYLL